MSTALIEQAIIERPILMKGEMVRPTLADIKTNTRRIINHLLFIGRISEFGKSDTPGYEWHFRDRRGLWNDISHDRLMHFCPYGKPGDRLWVRETWAQDLDCEVFYAADHPCMPSTIEKWRPSIFMPRGISRVKLEIMDIRVERVQDITEEGAKAEGIMLPERTCTMYDRIYSDAFEVLWDSINAKRGFGWDKNPFVWVIIFRRLKEAA